MGKRKYNGYNNHDSNNDETLDLETPIEEGETTEEEFEVIDNEEEMIDPVPDTTESSTEEVKEETVEEPVEKEPIPTPLIMNDFITAEPVTSINTIKAIKVVINNNGNINTAGNKKIFTPGKKVHLHGAKTYANSKSEHCKGVFNGIFYVVDGVQRDGRIKVTSKGNRITMSGYVDISDIR